MDITKQGRNRITEGNILKDMTAYLLPIMAGTLFQQLYNTVDTIVVGQFVGSKYLGCVGGSSGAIINLIVNFFVALSSGATVVIGKYYGARQREHLDDALHTAAAFAVVGGIITTLIGVTLSPTLLRLLKTPDDIIDGSITYLTIYFAGALFMFVYNVGSAILRAMGDSKRPLYYLIVCALINIVLDLTFVAGFKMGVAGVAIATLIAQAISSVLTVRALMKGDELYQLSIRKIRFHKQHLLDIIAIGLPSGIQNLMYSGSNLIVSTSINTLGTNTVSANAAYDRIGSLFWMFSGSVNVAVTTFVSQNFGAGHYDRVRKSAMTALGIHASVSVAFGTLVYFFCPYILLLFTRDPAVIAIGVQIAHILGPAYVTFSCIEVLAGALKGLGDVLVPTIMTCVGVCVVRVVWLLAVVPLRHTIEMVLLAYPISWLLTSIGFIIYYPLRMRRPSKRA